MAEPLPDVILASIRKRVGRTRQVAKDKGQILTQADIDRAHLLAEVDRLRARADDVRAIHPREINAVSMRPVCGSCRDSSEDPMPWPCPTIAELDDLDGTS
ncbi:MAG: hypothetical protein V4597_14590 [Pseudomonadota bacterium]